MRYQKIVQIMFSSFIFVCNGTDGSILVLKIQFEKTYFEFEYFQGAWSSHDPESGAIRKI